MAVSRLGSPISSSGLADLYDWGARCVVKLYRADCSEDAAEREAAKARTARSLGINTPRIVDVVKMENRVGFIFEKPDGPTLLHALVEDPKRSDELAHLMAALHADLHGREAPGLPAQRDYLRTNIVRAKGLSEAMKAAVLDRLESLPDARAACHGDFHPGNLVLGSGGPTILGWFDATRGNPLADVVRTSLVLSVATPPLLPQPRHFHAIESVRAAFRSSYLQRYGELRPHEARDRLAWELPVAAARLSEPVSVSEYNALVRKVGDLLGGRA